MSRKLAHDLEPKELSAIDIAKQSAQGVKRVSDALDTLQKALTRREKQLLAACKTIEALVGAHCCKLHVSATSSEPNITNQCDACQRAFALMRPDYGIEVPALFGTVGVRASCAKDRADLELSVQRATA